MVDNGIEFPELQDVQIDVEIGDTTLDVLVEEQTLDVSIGADNFDINVEGVWVRAGRDEIDSYLNTKVKPELDEHAQNLETDFDVIFEDKNAEFNQNASEKTSAFNSNATSKTNEFNENASTKTVYFDANAITQISSFNGNVTAKISEFDTNASNQQSVFNSNATSKTNNFNDNASNKTTVFNQNASNKQAIIDAAVSEAEAFATSANTSKELAQTSANSASVAAKEAKDAALSIGSVYRPKGSVNTYSDLPTLGNAIGDVWNVFDTDDNYVWVDPGKWDKLGGTVDLTPYVKSADLSTVATTGDYNDLSNKPSPYTLPTASTTTLGGVKVDGLSITINNGVISSINQVDLTSNQQISGQKSFSNPIVSNPSLGTANFRCIDPSTDKLVGEIYAYRPSVENNTMLFRVWNDSGSEYEDFLFSYMGGNPEIRLNNDTIRFVAQQYKLGYQWYRIWSDGWKEQGGFAESGYFGAPATTNFLTPFKDNVYTIVGTSAYDNPQHTIDSVYFTNRTPNGFNSIGAFNGANPGRIWFSWYACGY